LIGVSLNQASCWCLVAVGEGDEAAPVSHWQPSNRYIL